ncbi:MAG: DinB family protein [Acidimicrobiia bacterium]|nr:DinB family protein [Acidimicrobiia bacterium]
MGCETSLSELLTEYERALAYTDALWRDLGDDELLWRPHEESSAIGWHLGHQAAVAHFMIRNLTAAEPSPDPDLDGLMDSATPERQRGVLPPVERIDGYRRAVTERVRVRIGAIEAGDVGAPDQLRRIASTLLVAIINHEYQHDQWIGEVRNEALGHPLPERPTSALLTTLDGYLVLTG